MKVEREGLREVILSVIRHVQDEETAADMIHLILEVAMEPPPPPAEPAPKRTRKTKERAAVPLEPLDPARYYPFDVAVRFTGYSRNHLHVIMKNDGAVRSRKEGVHRVILGEDIVRIARDRKQKEITDQVGGSAPTDRPTAA